MKKCLVLFGLLLFVLCGCGKKNASDLTKEFSNKVSNSKSYKLSGTMEISSSEEVFTYSLESYFLKDDFYKVVLVNQTNNHEQIILKNKEGLFVVTPALNKSFKFDSIWPENSSQAYLLGNLVTDLKNDNEVEFEEKDDGYVLKSKVNYPNNEELKYQKMYFDKKMNINKVEVYDGNDIVKIKVNFNEVNLKAKLNEDDFVLDDLIENVPQENTPTEENKPEEKEPCTSENCESETSSILDNIIYPLYIPANTYLSDSESVSTEDSSRVILTFSGEKNFVIVEEVAKASNEFEVIPVYGDPLMLYESIGALSSNSLSWQANEISYYLVSSDLSTKEMISVASSLGNSSLVSNVK